MLIMKLSKHIMKDLSKEKVNLLNKLTLYMMVGESQP